MGTPCFVSKYFVYYVCSGYISEAGRRVASCGRGIVDDSAATSVASPEPWPCHALCLCLRNRSSILMRS